MIVGMAIHAVSLIHLLPFLALQTYLDGRPLVSMPPRTIVWQPVENLSLSETFCYAYLEILASKECRRLADLVRHLEQLHTVTYLPPCRFAFKSVSRAHPDKQLAVCPCWHPPGDGPGQ